MLYMKKTFTLPAAGKDVTQEKWDRAFMTSEEFEAKYAPKLAKVLQFPLPVDDHKVAEGVG